MEMLTSKEYAKLIGETVEEKENRDAYEANLIAMGKDSAYQIEDAYKQGAILTVKYVMDTYFTVKNDFREQSGLSWEALECMLADISVNFLEDII